MKSYIVATCVDYSYELREPKFLFFPICFKERQYKKKKEALSMQESPVNVKISSISQIQG